MQNEVNKIYHRPWGHYQTLAIASNYQVKIIHVLPGGKLSLQKHLQRSEHWVVVAGQPALTVQGKRRIYRVNESVYIPQESLHRIENFSDQPCVLVEVQVGNYLGEDDIVRVADVYGR